MTDRRVVLYAALTLIALPAAIVPIEAVAFHSANRENGSFISSGEKREYVLYVPKSYDRSKPTPLVISMHGAGLWGAAQRDVSRWNALADSKGFIVVYPSGVGGNGVRIWRAEPGDGLRKDVRFISDLIDTLSATYNIDSTRTYANGLSNGGGMSFALSCALSNRIAAVGLVAAAETLPWSWCMREAGGERREGRGERREAGGERREAERPVPVISFHGTADPVVPYNGGASWISPRPFPSVPRWSANWAQRNRCVGKPVESRVSGDVTRVEYTGCAGNASVVLYTIQGGGHTWPGGKALPEWFVGRTAQSIDATSLMWAFFTAHPRG
ncbi:MAG TPA: PHB depolymerase family esterase [Gemmatimonadaceae bacterium]|nr:PHB depolymerase family esterase [Gemmatimonadaceae bacterium]